MFSRRTAWTQENPLLLRLAREAKARGNRVKDLTESNPTRSQISLSPVSLSESVSADASSYDPHPKGLPSARRALAEWYRTFGNDVSDENIVLTASTSEAYTYLLNLLCESGDEILAPRPGYPLFEIIGQLSDVNICQYDLKYDGEWFIDMSSLESSITSKTRAVIAIHPNNPTGSYVKEEEWRKIVALCERRRLAVIVDEVFLSYALDLPAETTRSYAGANQCLTFVLSGLSKLAGMPQHKLAWMAVSGPSDAVKGAITRLEVIADTFLSVATPIQLALPALLANADSLNAPLRSRVAQTLAIARDELSSAANAVELLRCEGGGSAILRLPSVMTDDEWALRFLRNKNVLVYPGHYFDLLDACFVVVSLLPPPEVFREGIRDIVGEVLLTVGEG